MKEQIEFLRIHKFKASKTPQRKIQMMVRKTWYHFTIQNPFADI